MQLHSANQTDTMNASPVLLLLAVLPVAVLSLPWNNWMDASLRKSLFQMNEDVQPFVLSQSLGDFKGCYSDTDGKILGREGLTTESNTNINADCQISCMEKGYSVASTKGKNCYCTHSLPLPLLYPANDPLAAGNNGPCSMTCPGAWLNENCLFDECCGGENAYSVYTVGSNKNEEQEESSEHEESNNEYRIHEYQGGHIPEDISRVPENREQEESEESEESKSGSDSSKQLIQELAETQLNTLDVADIEAMARFEGCYSSETLDGNANVKKYDWSNNFNAKCQLKCQDEGYAIAATKGSLCYCLNTLPLPQLHSAESDQAAGNGGKCSTVCPGVFSTGSCHGDECCGGKSAVSVYIVGTIDVLKQLARRLTDRIKHNTRAREILIERAGVGKIHLKDVYLSYGCITRYPIREIKSGPAPNPNGRTLKLFHRSSFDDDVEITRDYLSNRCTISRFKLIANYSSSKWKSSKYMRDIWISLSSPHKPHWVAGTPDPKDRTKRIVDLEGLSDTGNWYSVSVPCKPNLKDVTIELWGTCGDTVPGPSSPITVSVIASGITATKSGTGTMKVYKLTTKWDGTETLEEIPLSNSPLKGFEQTSLRAISMEKILESDSLVEEKPFGGWDVVCDYTFAGSGENKCKKEYTEETSFEESWSTEHGFDMQVTVGAEFEAGTLFAKAKTTFELSLGYSFTSGYTKTKSKTSSATFGVEAQVPEGGKMEVRFFKADIPVKVKWRASIFADGFAQVQLFKDKDGSSYGPPIKVHLSELLTHAERTLYAFGTINYGDRPTLIARTQVKDRNGRLVSTNKDEKPAGNKSP